MSDFCSGCAYDNKARTGPRACPFNTLYWNFLIENEATLRSNPRLGPAVLGLSRVGQEERNTITKQAEKFLHSLQPADWPLGDP